MTSSVLRVSSAIRIAIAFALAVCAAHVAVALATPGGAARPARTTHSAEIGIASSRYLSSDPARLRSLGARWAYNWSATPPPRHPGLQWVPMVWGAGSVTASSLATLRAARRDGDARYLLGFNEPDNGGQSNMSPSQAAALWPKLERTGLILGSPAPAVPTDGWLAKFMTIAKHRHLRVDFIALHYYQDVTNPGSIPALRSQLIAIHRRYHRPIWITEIGALNLRSWGEPMLHRISQRAVTTYLRRLAPMLDGLSFVQRWAWFTDACTNTPDCRFSSLVNARGRTSATGRAFRRLADS